MRVPTLEVLDVQGTPLVAPQVGVDEDHVCIVYDTDGAVMCEVAFRKAEAGSNLAQSAAATAAIVKGAKGMMSKDVISNDYVQAGWRQDWEAGVKYDRMPMATKDGHLVHVKVRTTRAPPPTLTTPPPPSRRASPPVCTMGARTLAGSSPRRGACCWRSVPWSRARAPPPQGRRSRRRTALPRSPTARTTGWCARTPQRSA
jgi:hypothetical protein